ncbi:four helix bundle protein [Mucilaginibacter sabulilitoris]|uniref:Four helix bundle protein n=1 Tax=Mucilaginibacter sabulilitoris TaxID=1173583 RepID=A0ABZ0TRC8_9SPHI|nr:four helix bundle protein [Mucilaginibacter sabulilitoris]WPU94987.1 four helix bundle protein [Mucilaginibacter sabulilitoris]
MQKFKELILWQEAHQLTLKIYEASKKFPKEEIFGVTSQPRRAATSISCNIAEGCGRHTAKDFANFLQISLGSTNETDYLTILAKDLNYLSENDFNILQEKINKVRAMNINLIEKVRNK